MYSSYPTELRLNVVGRRLSVGRQRFTVVVGVTVCGWTNRFVSDDGRRWRVVRLVGLFAVVLGRGGAGLCCGRQGRVLVDADDRHNVLVAWRLRFALRRRLVRVHRLETPALWTHGQRGRTRCRMKRTGRRAGRPVDQLSLTALTGVGRGQPRAGWIWVVRRLARVTGNRVWPKQTIAARSYETPFTHLFNSPFPRQTRAYR